MGQVTLARILCFWYSPIKALYAVNKIKGSMIAAKIM
jgi:hypothetical protein